MLEREEAREAIMRSRERIAHNVRQMVRDMDHWNRAHPTETPLDVDDGGKLAGALALIGLDLVQLKREALRAT